MHWTTRPDKVDADSFESVPWGQTPLWTWAVQRAASGEWQQLLTLRDWMESACEAPEEHSLDSTPYWQQTSTAGMVWSLSALGLWGQQKQHQELADALRNACQAYEQLWGSNGAEVVRVRVGDITACLIQLAEPYPTGSSMVRTLLSRALADAEVPEVPPELRTGDPVHEVQLSILLGSRNRGRLLPLRMTLFEDSGSDARIWHPDPVRLGMLQADAAFRRALDSAWAWATSNQLFSARSRVVWSIDRFEGVPSLNGASAGAVFAVGLQGLKDQSEFDAGVVLTATVTDDGQLGPVEHILKKAKAARRKDRQQLILHPDNLRENETDVAAASDMQLIAATIVREAADLCASRTQEIRQFLERLVENGLRRFVPFRPDHVQTGREIVEFCVRERIVSEVEWQQFKSRQEQYARDRKRRRRSDTDPSPPPPPQPASLKDVRDQFIDGPLIVEGEPGEGKTTVLWLEMARECHQLLASLSSGSKGPSSPNFPVPLVLPLINLDTTSNDDLTIQAMEATVRIAFETLSGDHNEESIRNWIKEKLTRGEYSLFLDALDEMPNGRTDREWIRKQLAPETRVLITTRRTANAADLNTPQDRRVRTVPLSEVQIRVCGERWSESSHVPPTRAAILKCPRGNIVELLGIPLQFAAYCQTVVDTDDPPPQTKTELLQACLHGLFARGDRRRSEQPSSGVRNSGRTDPDLRNGEKERVLRHLAWHFQVEEPQPMKKTTLYNVLKQHVDLIEIDPPRNAAELLQEFIDDGVLVPAGRNSCQFIVRSLHEFCLAGWIALESPFRSAGRFSQVVTGSGANWEHPDCRWTEFTPWQCDDWEPVWPLVAGQMSNDIDLFWSCWPELPDISTVPSLVTRRIPRCLDESGEDSPSSRQTSYTIRQAFRRNLGIIYSIEHTDYSTSTTDSSNVRWIEDFHMESGDSTSWWDIRASWWDFLNSIDWGSWWQYLQNTAESPQNTTHDKTGPTALLESLRKYIDYDHKLSVAGHYGDPIVEQIACAQLLEDHGYYCGWNDEIWSEIAKDKRHHPEYRIKCFELAALFQRHLPLLEPISNDSSEYGALRILSKAFLRRAEDYSGCPAGQLCWDAYQPWLSPEAIDKPLDDWNAIADALDEIDSESSGYYDWLSPWGGSPIGRHWRHTGCLELLRDSLLTTDVAAPVRWRIVDAIGKIAGIHHLGVAPELTFSREKLVGPLNPRHDGQHDERSRDWFLDDVRRRAVALLMDRIMDRREDDAIRAESAVCLASATFDDPIPVFEQIARDSTESPQIRRSCLDLILEKQQESVAVRCLSELVLNKQDAADLRQFAAAQFRSSLELTEQAETLAGEEFVLALGAIDVMVSDLGKPDNIEE